MLALVAEDSKTQAFQLRTLLEANGFEVVVAPDGEEALAAVARRRPDVIVSDVLMPRRDGFALCRRLKEDPQTASIPVILLTSVGDALAVVRALAAGADNFVTKPFDGPQLVERVRRTMAGRKAGSGRVEVANEVLEIEGDKGRILDVLVSALEDMTMRNAELEASRQALAQANARRDEVLHVVSHELRGPLGVLTMSADVFAVDAAVSAPPEKQHAFAQRVARQSQRMLTIVDDLLDVTRIDAGELRVEPAPGDLAQVVRDAIDRLKPSLGKHTVELVSPPSVRVALDVDRIEQVITNFLTNAVKYSPAGGRILVTVAVEGSRVRVSVKDEGIGIEPAALPRIYERYFRAPGATKTAKGIGLGLFVTKRIVLAHRGTVHVESEPGKGSTFSFELPV